MEAVVLAAGNSTRMGGETEKQLLRLGGKPMVIFVLERLLEHRDVEHIYVTVRGDHVDMIGDLLNTYRLSEEVTPVIGGLSRQASVLAALRHVNSERVLIHEAARPIINETLIDRVIQADGVAVVPVVEIPFTVALGAEKMIGEIDRESLRNVQLPQVFDTKVVLEAHLEASAAGSTATEDSQLVFRRGHEVTFVKGLVQNMKITYPGDLALAEALIYQQAELL